MPKLIDGCKSILVRCRFCGRLRKYELNIFNIKKNNPLEYKCECGEINVKLARINNKGKLEVACFDCGDVHYFILDLQQILKSRNILYCIFGRKLCFIGSEEKANQMILENQANLRDNSNIIYKEDYFTNFNILEKVLKQLYNLNKEGKINCDCGKFKIDVQLFPDRLELKCNNCHSVKIIFTETQEDLSIIMNKDKIMLREHNISCIDSIVEKNRDIKK